MAVTEHFIFTYRIKKYYVALSKDLDLAGLWFFFNFLIAINFYFLILKTFYISLPNFKPFLILMLKFTLLHFLPCYTKRMRLGNLLHVSAFNFNFLQLLGKMFGFAFGGVSVF